MRWRTIRCAVLLLLLAANMVMFWLLRTQEKGPGNITREEWEAVRDIYEKSGILWNPEAETTVYYPAKILQLKRTDMRMSAWNILGRDAAETYLYGSVTRYSRDGNVMILNSDNSSVEYSRGSRTGEKMAESEARRAGEIFLQSFSPYDIELELYSARETERGWTFAYYQRLGGELLLFNQAELQVDGEGVRKGILTYYSIEEQTVSTATEYPLDELLYQCLRRIEAQEKKVHELNRIEYVYRIEIQGDDIRGIPCILFSFDEEVTYVIERIIL